MALKDEYNFEYLVNEAERLVIDELERVLAAQEGPICTCQDCVLDMAAMALNRVRAMYRVSLLGKLYADMPSPDYAESISAAVQAAVSKIRNNPSHD